MLEQAGDRALAAADGSMQQQDALLDAVALGSAFEGVDQVLQRLVEAEDGVAALVFRVVEELVVDPLDAARLFIDGRAGRHDHVIDALKGVSGDLGLLTHEIEVFLERPNPVLLAELFEVLSLGDQRDDFATVAHLDPPRLWWRWAKPAGVRRFSPAPPSLFAACRFSSAGRLSPRVMFSCDERSLDCA